MIIKPQTYYEFDQNGNMVSVPIEDCPLKQQNSTTTTQSTTQTQPVTETQPATQAQPSVKTDANGKVDISDVLNDIDLGPTDSIQFMFAKLQLAQSMICKSNAENYLKQIEETQAEQTKAAEMISRARALQQEAKNSEEATTMPADMVEYFKERGLSFDTLGDDNWHNFDEWTYNIQSLTNYQESISNQTQTKMVYLQDMISQYNSYLQGAMSAIQKATQVLERIATSA